MYVCKYIYIYKYIFFIYWVVSIIVEKVVVNVYASLDTMLLVRIEAFLERTLQVNGVPLGHSLAFCRKIVD